MSTKDEMINAQGEAFDWFVAGFEFHSGKTVMAGSDELKDLCVEFDERWNAVQKVKE